MRILRQIESSIKDLALAGPRFWLGGLRAKLLNSSQITVSVPGNLLARVRPKTSDFSVLRQIFRNREYALPDGYVRARVEAEYARILASGGVPVIVDAGANIGAASIWFHQQFPKASIVAIEPDPGNAVMVRANTEHLPEVVVLQAAIGGEPGFVTVMPAKDAWAMQTERSESGCAIVTVADAVRHVPGGVPFIVKIDIEGFEADLFANNIDWIDETLLIFIEPHDWMLPGQATSRSFQRAFGSRMFEIFIRGENLLYLRADTSLQ